MTYGVGIVGTGLVAEVHAGALAEAEGVRLVSILSRSPERAAAFAARYGCAPFTEMSAFLADKDLNIVSVCTPPGTHLEPALRAIEAGRHVLIEKPLEITLERCDAIIEAAARRGVLASGIFQSRFHDAPRLLKRAVDEGRFGRLVLGEASVKWHRSQEYYDRGGWKGRKEFEAGAVMNQAIHAIDLLQWCLGPVRTVYAFADTLGHERLEVEDAAVAALRFSNGSLGIIQASTAAYPGFKKRIEVSGTRGSAIIEEEDLKFWSFDPSRPEDGEIRSAMAARTRTGGGAADPAAIGTHGHRLQYEELAHALSTRRAPSVDAVEARKAVAIILAVYRSARSGAPVRLEG